MATNISKLADVHPDARIGEDVHIGPFCAVGPEAEIGSHTRLESGVTLMGRVLLGEHNHIYPQVVIGAPPQDLSYRGVGTTVEIGDHNVIRECVTINQATEKEDLITSMGSHCYLMACAHVAHDCRLGNGIVIANAVLLGGHVHVDDYANLSGGLAVHHFARIGAYAFVAGMSRVVHDAPPYMIVDGSPARPRCVNHVGLKRNNFSRQAIRALTEAHRLVYREHVGLDAARERLRQNEMLVPTVNHLLSFIQVQQEGSHGRGREKRRAA